MITKFKIFEELDELDSTYKVGDYVNTKYSLTPIENYRFKINFVNIRTPVHSISPFHYSAEDIYGKKHHLTDDDILREMTSDEIRQFETDYLANKFNV